MQLNQGRGVSALPYFHAPITGRDQSQASDGIVVVNPREYYVELDANSIAGDTSFELKATEARSIAISLLLAADATDRAQRDRQAHKDGIKAQLTPNARELVETLERLGPLDSEGQQLPSANEPYSQDSPDTPLGELLQLAKRLSSITAIDVTTDAQLRVVMSQLGTSAVRRALKAFND